MNLTELFASDLTDAQRAAIVAMRDELTDAATKNSLAIVAAREAAEAKVKDLTVERDGLKTELNAALVAQKTTEQQLATVRGAMDRVREELAEARTAREKAEKEHGDLSAITDQLVTQAEVVLNDPKLTAEEKVAASERIVSVARTPKLDRQIAELQAIRAKANADLDARLAALEAQKGA